MLADAGRLKNIFIDKANKMTEGTGRFSQQVAHARVKMDLNSENASAQSMAKKMAVLAKEAEEACTAPFTGGQTAAGVATQLLAAGAVDS